jgi:hypothetical protein
LGAFGVLWIGAILTFLLFKSGVPIAWKVAWLLYGGVGLVDMSAMLAGRDSEKWDRSMRRVQIVAFMVAVFLFAIGALQLDSN